MPLLRQFQNDIKHYILAVLCTGTLLYGVYTNQKTQSRFDSLERKVSSELNKHDARINCVDENVKSGIDSLEFEIARISSQDIHLSEKRLNALEAEIAKVDSLAKINSHVHAGRLNAIDACVKVVLSHIQNGKLVSPASSAGTIVYSEKNASGKYDNYVLCASHGINYGVVELLKNPSLVNSVITVQTFKNLNFNETHYVKIVLDDVVKDWALLKFESHQKLPVSKIADESAIKNAGSLSEMYTVGTPTGLPPVLSEGRLQTKNIYFNGKKYWIVTSPIVYGNSGGGVYLNDGRLIGMINMCGLASVNDALKVPIYHIALMTPFVGLGGWLDKEKLSFVYK